jgi:protein-S-isoprenylcysteine O-methyltransferase Ste14
MFSTRIGFLLALAVVVARTVAEALLQPRPKRVVAPEHRALPSLLALTLSHSAAAVAVAVVLWRAQTGITPQLAAGLALVAMGFAGRVVSFRYLGGGFSTAVAPDATGGLCTSGPYALLRHPLYAFYLLEMAGFLVADANLICVLALLAVLAATVVRMPKEEALLEAQFGPAYREYCARTRRLIPFVY